MVLCFSLGLENSVILRNRNHLTSLSNWLKPVAKSVNSLWKRCWRASVDGWAASTFHSQCDGKGPTVTIVRVGRYIIVYHGVSDHCKETRFGNPCAVTRMIDMCTEAKAPSSVNPVRHSWFRGVHSTYFRRGVSTPRFNPLIK